MFFNALGFFLSKKNRQNLDFFCQKTWPRKCIWAAYWHSLQIFALLTRVCNH